MKVLFFFIIALSLNSTILAQNWYSYNFDGNDPTESQFTSMYIDTLSNPNNIWQIGLPQKPNFPSSYTSPNAIITDTINTYPINDTSSFVIVHMPELGILMPWYFVIGGYYAVDSDTLTDFGLVEMSYNNGNSWMNIFEIEHVLDLNGPSSSSKIPVFTGNSNGWTFFHVTLSGLFKHLGVLGQGQPEFDTLLIRYSFISDEIQTNKSGLMFDSLFVIDVSPIGLTELNEVHFNIFPNPTNNSFQVSFQNNAPEVYTINLYDAMGGRVKSFENISESYDVSDLPSGFYNVLIISSDKVLQTTLIIER